MKSTYFRSTSFPWFYATKRRKSPRILPNLGFFWASWSGPFSFVRCFINDALTQSNFCVPKPEIFYGLSHMHKSLWNDAYTAAWRNPGQWWGQKPQAPGHLHTTRSMVSDPDPSDLKVTGGVRIYDLKSNYSLAEIPVINNLNLITNKLVLSNN